MRATKKTFKSIATNLLEPLDADVMMCVSSPSPDALKDDPFVHIAKHLVIVNNTVD